ncbi:protein of unknown function [Rhodovastum atsumiense]|nr:protein of unknown function [Rhodovastum atsumiense]
MADRSAARCHGLTDCRLPGQWFLGTGRGSAELSIGSLEVPGTGRAGGAADPGSGNSRRPGSLRNFHPERQAATRAFRNCAGRLNNMGRAKNRIA